MAPPARPQGRPGTSLPCMPSGVTDTVGGLGKTQNPSDVLEPAASEPVLQPWGVPVPPLSARSEAGLSRHKTPEEKGDRDTTSRSPAGVLHVVQGDRALQEVHRLLVHPRAAPSEAGSGVLGTEPLPDRQTGARGSGSCHSVSLGGFSDPGGHQDCPGPTPTLLLFLILFPQLDS